MSELTPEAAAVEASTEQPAVNNEQVTPVEQVDGEQKPVDEAKPVEPKAEEPKKNHDQRRWERLLSERAEYKAKLEMYEKMNSQQRPENDTGEPKREQFQDDISWINAVRKYDRELIKQEIMSIQQPQNSEAKLEKARQSYPDFDDVIQEAKFSNIQIPDDAFKAMLNSDLEHDIRYYIAKNPNEAEKLWSYSNPYDQIKAIGRIEAKIEASKNAKPVKVSQAPKPITPVKTNGVPETVDRDKLSDREWFELRRKERQKALMGQT